MSRERAELSKKNPYHIPRYRYYELKYFCRQYDDWKKALTLIDGWQTSPNDISGIIKGCPPESPTERIALSRVFYSSCIDIVDRCIAELDTALAPYMLLTVSKVLGEVFNAVSPLAGGFLSITASLGDCLVEMANAVNNSKTFKTTLDGIHWIIGKVSEGMQTFAGVLTDVSNNVSVVFDPLKTLGEWFENFISFITPKLKWLADKIGEIFEELGSGASGAFGNLNGNALWGFANAGMIAGLIAGIKGFLEAFKDIGSTVKDTIGGVAELLNKLGEAVTAWKNNKNAETLKTISTAVAILAGSLVVLSMVKPERLAASTGAMIALFAELLVALAIYDEIAKKTKKVGKGTSSMVVMAAGVLILTSALKKISEIETEKLLTSVIALGAVMAELVAAQVAISKWAKDGAKHAMSMLAMAAAVRVLAEAVEQLADLGWDGIEKGLIAVAGLLAEVAAFSGLSNFGGLTAGKAVGILILAAALSVLEKSVSAFSKILVCFCVDENATVDDDGCLTANSGPEIQSNYFGMNGVFGRWGKFGLPYRVYDADGDTITVTEKLNGKVRRTFRAIQNGVYRFEISQKELESFDWNADYILTVEASDGRTTNRKSCKVNRIRSSGYVVYIGQIKGTADGQSYYWTERNILDDPFNENAPVILDPEVTLEANEISSFTFTVPVSNPFYDKLELKKPVVSIEEDGREIFMGYITEMEKNFELDMEVTCESEFGYLQDRDCRVENKFYTAAELLALALTVEDDPEEHVGFKGEGKVFLPGNVTIEKPESDTDKETKAISDCWSVLTNSLTGKYGGYLRLRKEIKMVDGVRVYTRYLDYLAKLNDKTDQVIELGKNLLDISYYIKAGDIVNSVKAYGWYKSGWLIWETTNPISREAYNGKSIKKYGLCQRVLVVEGTDSTEDSLLKKATDELKKYSGFTGSVQINAADLCDIGVDTDRLDFMKETYVLSEPHGIDDWLPCTKEVIPLHELDQKDFTFGATTAKLSSLQAGNFATAGKAWNAIQSTIGYINK